MMLRRAGLGLLVGAVLMAPSGASAGPALVFEPYNGTVFYAEDPDAQWFPASLTKLMTAYVAFQALKAGTVTPDTKLICSKEATEQAPSKLWLKVGKSITLDVALKVLIVELAPAARRRSSSAGGGHLPLVGQAVDVGESGPPQCGGERDPGRPQAGRRRAGRAVIGNAPHARDRSLGERLQALFLEVAVRHQHRRAGDPSLVDRWAGAFEGRHLRRRQTEAVRYAQGQSQGQSQGRLEEAQHPHRRQLSGHVRFGSVADTSERVWDVRFAPVSGHTAGSRGCLL